MAHPDHERLLETLNGILAGLKLLIHEVSALRQAVDELATEVQWRNNQDGGTHFQDDPRSC
jgi:hypothetical protein